MVILNDLSKSQSFPGAKHVFFGHKEIVTYEEFTIYSFVIPLFHLIFHGEFISGLLFNF